MNERLEELMYEAFDTADYPSDQENLHKPSKAFCDKFAQLIVKETLAIIRGNIHGKGEFDPTCSIMEIAADSRAKAIYNEVKSHFGDK